MQVLQEHSPATIHVGHKGVTEILILLDLSFAEQLCPRPEYHSQCGQTFDL
jgi:hypothetical protein